MEPMEKCLYYMVRANGGGIPEEDKYFNDALAQIRENGLSSFKMSKIELLGLINAARRRGMLDELDEAVGA